MAKFLAVIEARKAALQAELAAQDADLQKKIDELTAKSKLDGKSLRLQIKRLEHMIEIYKENDKDFDHYDVKEQA